MTIIFGEKSSNDLFDVCAWCVYVVTDEIDLRDSSTERCVLNQPKGSVMHEVSW